MKLDLNRWYKVGAIADDALRLPTKIDSYSHLIVPGCPAPILSLLQFGVNFNNHFQRSVWWRRPALFVSCFR